jgi:hypothetical protein
MKLEQNIMKSIKEKSKTVRLIKNLHSEKEMEEKSKRFVAHKKPFLSLEDVFRLESEKQMNTLLVNH